jgi:hypothetical protein
MKCLPARWTAFGRPGDVLIGISTSGRFGKRDPGRQARQIHGYDRPWGCWEKTAASLNTLVDQAIVVDSATTARIQETHIFILHYWAWQIERGLPQTRGDQRLSTISIHDHLADRLSRTAGTRGGGSDAGLLLLGRCPPDFS